MGVKERVAPSGAAVEEEAAHRESRQRILDQLKSGSPFKYLLGATRRERTGITPEEAQEQYRLASELFKQIESGVDLPNLDSLYDDNHYGFLEDPYLGVGVTGWGALQMLLNQKRFGKN